MSYASRAEAGYLVVGVVGSLVLVGVCGFLMGSKGNLATAFLGGVGVATTTIGFFSFAIAGDAAKGERP